MTLLIFRAVAIFHRERLFPIFPVPILDANGNGRADRLPVANSGEKFSGVLFDLLPPAAPPSQLTPMHFPTHEFKIDRHTRRDSRNPGDQRLPVRFTGRNESKHIQQRPSQSGISRITSIVANEEFYRTHRRA